MSSELSPTARALLTLELLQRQPGITAERLADRLGVTTRAVRRYVAILREAEIPVESVRGRDGGYRLGRGLRLPPVVFDSVEALALVMATLDGHHDADDPDDPAGRALGKLVRALPAAVAAQAEAVRRTAAPAPDRAAARPDPTTTVALVEACAAHQRVRLTYVSERGSRFDAEVEPWAVVVRHGRWYLLCHSVTSDGVRAYRVDRVHAVEALRARFDPPNDLDPVAALEQHLATGWEYAVEIVLDCPLEQVARRVPPALGRLEEIDASHTRLVGSTDNPWWYAEQLVRLPAPIHVLGGPELRETTRVVGERLVSAASPA